MPGRDYKRGDDGGLLVSLAGATRLNGYYWPVTDGSVGTSLSGGNLTQRKGYSLAYKQQGGEGVIELFTNNHACDATVAPRPRPPAYDWRAPYVHTFPYPLPTRARHIPAPPCLGGS